MGNWRTVKITGTCPPEQVEALKSALAQDSAYSKYGPLVYSQSLCGLGLWPAKVIDASGNLYERDFSVEDVADHVRELLVVAPGLTLKIHCGGERESKEVIATITVADGAVTIGPAEQAELPEFDADVMVGRLLKATRGGQ